MNLGTSGVGVTAIATRKFNIKVTQYSCDYNNLAPSGCDQWFFGAGGAGTVKSFNFDGGLHLADQKQSICVRRETGNCRICWTAADVADVNIAGNADQGKVTVSNLKFSADGHATKFRPKFVFQTCYDRKRNAEKCHLVATLQILILYLLGIRMLCLWSCWYCDGRI